MNEFVSKPNGAKEEVTVQKKTGSVIKLLDPKKIRIGEIRLATSVEEAAQPDWLGVPADARVITQVIVSMQPRAADALAVTFKGVTPACGVKQWTWDAKAGDPKYAGLRALYDFIRDRRGRLADDD
jgi:hypothetical protein